MIRAMLRVAVVAHPGARSERIEAGDHSELHVWVRARPVEGQANAAIERVIASGLGLKWARCVSRPGRVAGVRSSSSICPARRRCNLAYWHISCERTGPKNGYC